MDVNTPEQFAEVFQGWCSQVPGAPDVELAQRYAYLAFIETQIDLELFDDPHPHAAHNLRISDFGVALPRGTGRVFGGKDPCGFGPKNRSTVPLPTRFWTGTAATDGYRRPDSRNHHRVVWLSGVGAIAHRPCGDTGLSGLDRAAREPDYRSRDGNR